jgi:hypothetical protein
MSVDYGIGLMLWFEEGVEWSRRLSHSSDGVNLARIFEGPILRSRPPLEQLVPPRVRYGMTCLLIRNVIGSVSC